MMNFVKALLALFLFAYSQLSYADCSAYKGDATLNEIGMDQEEFIEIKLLDTSIPQASYQAWSITICKDEGQGSCSTLSLSGITPSNSAYLVVPITNDYPKKHEKFDILLRDGNGDTIDYLSVEVTGQQDNNCSLGNDWEVPVSNTHNYHRSPDGVGAWDNSGDHADSDFTQGESNDGTTHPPVDPPNTGTGYCANVFVNGATSNASGGKIKIEGSPTLYDDPNGILATENLEGGNNLTCDGFGSCSATGTPTNTLDLGTFIDSSGGNTLNVNAPMTIGDSGENNFGTINMETGGVLSFSEDFTQYHIEKLHDGGNGSSETSIINLNAGDYYIEELKLYGNSTINVIGDGTVRLFLRDHSDFEGNIKVNDAGNVEQLLVYGYKEVHIKKTSRITGLIYSQTKVEIKDTAILTGAASAGEELKLKDTAKIYYECGDPAELIIDLRFDEDSWDGSADEVKDNSANGLDGQSFNDAETDDDTVALIGNPGTCGYGEFDGGLTYVAVPDNDLLDISDNLTLSAWVYPTKAGQQVIISKARRSSAINNYQLSLGAANTLLFQYRSAGVEKYLSSSFSVPLNTWSHIAFTYSSGEQRFYLNGSAGNNLSTNTGTLDTNDADLDIGAERLHSGLDFGAFYFEGSIDEVRVYDGALTSDQVLVVANETHACSPQDLELKLEYRFDECSYTDMLVDVTDHTANNYHGTSNGTITSYENAIVNTGLDLSDTNTDNWVSVPNESVNGLDDFSITTWFKVDLQEKKTHQIFYALGTGNNDKEIDIHLHIENSNSNKDRVHVHVANQGVDLDVDETLNDGDWHHLAFTRSGENICIFIDGVEEDCNDNASDNTIDINAANSVLIGQKLDNGSFKDSFEGQLEEFKIFAVKLTKEEIEVIYDNEDDGENYDGSTRAVQSCNTVPFFQIEHDGSGITCAAEPVLIKACDNGDCSNVDTSVDTNVTLSVNGVNQTIAIVGGVSSNAEFVYTDETTPAVLSLSSDFQCLNTIANSDSCTVIFSNAGFRFLYGDADSTVLPNQTSGTEFGESLKIQAVENVEGVCEGIFTGNTDVSLSQENVEPGGTGGLNFTVTIADTSIAKYPTFTPDITLNFDANSIATIPKPIYHDAGQIRLHAHYDVDDITLLGSSNTFWVSPAKLVITAKSGAKFLNGNSPDHTITHNAGEYFDLTASAYNSLGVVTPNYSPEQIQLKLKRTGPLLATSVDGEFKYAAQSSLTTSISSGFENVTLSNFSSGVSNYIEARYSEVGLLTLDIQDFNYGFLGNIIPSDVTEPIIPINIGRFIPDHFVQTVVESGSLDGVCKENTTFAYIGQTLVGNVTKGAISYLVNPVVELTAKNVQGDTTQNYTEGDYMKLDAAADFIIAPTTDSVITGKDTNLLPLTSNIAAGTVSHDGLVVGLQFGNPLDNGVLHYELSGDDNFVYSRDENSEINTQDNDINFVIDLVNFVDSDGVGINNGVGNDTPENITETLGINLRFGRGYLENSFGPETADLPQPFFVQYLDTNGKYVVNEQDDCTIFNVTQMALVSGTLDESETSVKDINGPAADGLLDEGETRDMLLAAPGAGKQGTINVEYGVYHWLTYDWDWNGVDAKDFNENPKAVATFGLFRGNDRIIYWREVSR